MQGANQSHGQGNDLQRALQRMAGEFLERLGLQVPLLEKFHTEVVKFGSNADPDLIHSEAHKISGVARTLGFSAIGDAAAELERLTTRGLWDAGVFDETPVLECIQGYLSELRLARRHADIQSESRRP